MAASDHGAPGGSRRATVARCAVAVRDQGPVTVAEAAQTTGLSRPTVEAAFAELSQQGLVREVTVADATRRGAGRPARRYRFVQEAGAVLGIDVGPHAVKYAIADLSGLVVAHGDVQTDDSFRGPGRMDTVVRIVHRALATAGIARSSLVSVSVAVPGWIGANGRLIVSKNLPDWEGTDLASHLEAEFGCAVRVDNDMRFAALAEHRLGAARLADDVIYLFAGHRLSMSLILGGQVRRGSHGAAGEVGDIIFSRHTDRSGELTWAGGRTGADVFRLAAQGEAAATQEVADFVDGLATGLATTVMAIDPDLVVVGGGLSRAGDTLLGPLRDRVNEIITVPIRPTIVASDFGTESAVLGALVHACKESTTVLFGVPGLSEPSIEIATNAIDSRQAAAGDRAGN